MCIQIRKPQDFLECWKTLHVDEIQHKKCKHDCNVGRKGYFGAKGLHRTAKRNDAYTFSCSHLRVKNRSRLSWTIIHQEVNPGWTGVIRGYYPVYPGWTSWCMPTQKTHGRYQRICDFLVLYIAVWVASVLRSRKARKLIRNEEETSRKFEQYETATVSERHNGLIGAKF